MSSIIGFPRMGENRELKFALEGFWGKKISLQELEQVAKDLRKKHYKIQGNLDYVCVNDFSFYDNMLDLAFMLGAVPHRFHEYLHKGDRFSAYFGAARGIDSHKAMEMTKWFNTNYHYVVPELSGHDSYKLSCDKIKHEVQEVKELGYKPKVSLIGIFTFAALSKIIDNTSFERVFDNLLPTYIKLVEEISQLDKNIAISFDEPIFVCGKDDRFFHRIKEVYDTLASFPIYSIVTTYFEHSNEATEILSQTKINALGLDFLHGKDNLKGLQAIAKSNKELFAGVIDGRNIWRANLENSLNLLEEIAKTVAKDKIHPSSSCSLLHSPFSKKCETNLKIAEWVSFSCEKITELEVLGIAFKKGVGELNATEKQVWEDSKKAASNRKSSPLIHKSSVQERVKSHKYTPRSPYAERIKAQKEALKYPILPTTTIGSFPQTPELRALRRDFKKGVIDENSYNKGIEDYIKDCVAFQEEVGLDVLVHGEPERNDMVEYFGEQLEGFAFTQNGWVQSYGSRCVKPPLIFGDISRPKPMTVRWSKFAQSLTKKPMKGMLTGPVTILNWSFVRDDLERKDVCHQLALAVYDEINDLQNAGINIIQVDEAAFKEGYPLRSEKVKAYEKWSVEFFRLATSVAKTQTQIHTHMCYSDFNAIIQTIADLDADVISIETARSGNELLKVFAKVGYSHEVGPGVYDIHSPHIPTKEEIIHQIKLLLEVLPKEQLWINPDCGLKTRKWEEVKPSLAHMVEAVKFFR